jgi:hypothetical protein
VEKFFNGDRRSRFEGREGRAMETLRRDCRRGVRRRKSGELVGAIISVFPFLQIVRGRVCASRVWKLK